MQLLDAIVRAQSRFIEDPLGTTAFDSLLADFLTLTHSPHGLLGEVLHTPEGDPFVETLSMTDMSWDEMSRAFYKSRKGAGLRFYRRHSLLGHVLTSGRVVISNDPSTDPRATGFPEGHPGLEAFIGFPVVHGNRQVAMIGLANRPGGYDEAVFEGLMPLCLTAAQLVVARQGRVAHQRSVNLLENVLKAATETAIIVTDVNGAITLFNEGAQRLLGYSPAEVLGQTPLRFHDPEEVAERAEQLSIQRGQKMEGFRVMVEMAECNGHEKRTWNYRHKEGRAVPVVLTVTPIRDERGGTTGYLGMAENISAQREQARREREGQAQLDRLLVQLQQSETLLRRVIDAMPHVVILKDSEGRFKLANATAARLYNTTPEAMIGRDDADFNANHAQVTFYRKSIQDVIAHGQTQVVLEDSTDATTGKVHHYQSVKVPFQNPGGGMSVLIVATDITALRETQDRLQDSEARMAYAFEATGDGLWDWDIVRNAVHHNAQWGRIVGLSDCPLAHPVEFFAERIYPEDREAVIARIHAAMEGKGSYFSEHRLVWPDGRVIWVQDRGRVVARDAQDRPLRMVGAIVDITERRTAEETLKEVMGKLQHSNEELEQFAYVASHDLRQPLRMVTSYIGLLEKTLNDRLDADTREMMHFAADGARRMDQMLVSLLEYSRVGRKGEPMTSFHSREAVDEALLFLGPLTTETQAQITVTGEWPVLVASRDELTRLFQNLIGNALKYRDPQRAPIIAVSVAATDEGWHFEVKDNGIGIDPAQFDRLFKVFQRLHARSQYEGTGIGLAMARKIVERHGGQIGVQSEGAGRGATFVVLWPSEVPT